MTEIILKQDTNISRLQLNTSMIWEIKDNRILKLVNQYVEQGHPFFTLRYLLAYEENKNELETLEKWCE